MYLQKILGGRINVPEPRVAPAGDGTYKVGDPLQIVSGKYELATGNVTVVAIAMEEKTLAADGTLLVAEIDANFIFRTKFSATPTNIVMGSVVTLASAGTGNVDVGKVTATPGGISVTVASTTGTLTGGHAAEIYDMLGATAAGDEVLVRFRQ